ncbi:MAG: selenocysteine-specific translation elongation factor, partial [Acidobacteriaceae bacterium]|nr:selenocysteine-specific translation elongation factor [Acidobacteriaceae bacterium]
MSNSNMQGSRGFLVGTAGHIDHGKTTLIRALTGIDTDRLVEEKKRGISIDLGFAHLTLASGQTVSFIDVPGHERFIKNMLAGVAGIHAVLLIVAVNESVMPQTREHFAICRLLGIERGVVVLTKIDSASPEEIEITRQEVAELCAGSFLENAPVVPVSAVTGEGLGRLRQELDKLAASIQRRSMGAVARLPIDRSFAAKGFGTVVTGTLWSGSLHPGDSVMLYPTRLEARIRGLQIHGQAVDEAVAGQRTAVNLAGIDHAEVERGFVLTRGGELETTRRIQAYARWLDSSRLPKVRQELVLYTGTSEISAECKILAQGEREGEAFVQIALTRPALVLPGDRFVLRKPSPADTVGGGTVIEALPPVRLNRVKTRERLAALSAADPAGRLELLVSENRNGIELSALCRKTGMAEADLRALLEKSQTLLLVDGERRVLTKKWLAEERQKLIEWLRAFHKSNPGLPGAPVVSARSNLPPALASLVFQTPEIKVTGEMVALASHRPQTTAQDSRMLLEIEQAFLSAGLQPPAISD